jgi:hypothetical protein
MTTTQASAPSQRPRFSLVSDPGLITAGRPARS